MKKLLHLGFLATVCCATAAEPGSASMDWPTLHGNLQRHGFYPQFPQGKLKLAWRKELFRELTGPRAEVIVGGGLAFMGTYAGNLYAWDAATGAERWVFKAGGPIGHAPAFSSGKVYFGAMDRKLYALDAAAGKTLWTFEAGEGIWGSPAVSGGKIMIGARDGTFYALNEADGKVAWKFATAAPILSSASVTEDGQRVVMVSEDMHAYCLRVNDGHLVWKSRQLAGVTARDYFPVLFRGLVFVTTAPVKDFHTILGQQEEMLVRRTGFTGADKRFIPGTREDVAREQDFIVAYLRAHPEEQVFYAFRDTDGTEPWIAPICYTGGLHNPLVPPCVNPQTSEVFTLLRSAYGTWDGGGEVRSFTCFGKLNLDNGRVTLVEHGYPAKEPGRPPGAKDMPWMTFNYIGDETQELTCAPGRLYCNHQGFLGELDLASGRTQNRFGKRDTYGGFYGPGNFGWEQNGGYEKAKAAGQPFGLVNEWHGPARAMVSVAGGRVYFPVGSQVLCLEEEK
jgi:outer membrane protein assembly factor BamB